jgi:anaerobic magnesium-protoporphyrin IX monomethyl ester cyclase
VHIRMVSLEDGITSCGFRKMAAYAARVNPDTDAFYVTTARYKTIRNGITGGRGSGSDLSDDEVDEVAHGLLGADMLGFSSMTGYAGLTRRVVKRVRELDRSVYMVWGGIHPIIHPEDAITADVDAICTGEGEFAFHELLDALREGRDPTALKNFWFKRGEEVTRNQFLPLMTAEEMETLPFPLYREKEKIFRPGEGFGPTKLADYVLNDGLSYTAIWSIGCPFHCTYCGNTKFIANDLKYKRIRHPSARYMVEQIKDVRRRSPQISHVNFQDDSFMAIPYPQLEEFAELWKAELDIPFAVYGVIPNYVKKDKFAILTWAGMNRVRMGIQSGSQEILDFYKRPSPPDKILAAGEVIGSFAPTYHLPPVYDIIMDNPIETRENVVETLELLYDMPRPFTLLIYSLKVIPNTELERAMKERGVELEQIDSSYLVIPPRAANLLLYLLCVVKPPRWLWQRLLKLARASAEEQKLYPRMGMFLRLLYLVRRVIPHVKRLDFSITPGWVGYWSWRLGLVGLWHRRFNPHLPKPEPPARRRAPARPVLTLVPDQPVASVAQEPARSAAADDGAR